MKTSVYTFVVLAAVLSASTVGLVAELREIDGHEWEDPASRPVGFQRPDYDISGWETIRVPCSWQAFGANGRGGWGTPLYTNSRYPFACNPPHVMDEPPKDFTSYAARTFSTSV